MTERKDFSFQELLAVLKEEVGRWDQSRYYMAEQELFDIEQFLDDHGAKEIRQDLERLYGTPLNERFWHSFLAYHRLKKAREAVKEEGLQHEEKRRRYEEAVRAYQSVWNDWVNAWVRETRRRQWKVIPGKKGDPEAPPS